MLDHSPHSAALLCLAHGALDGKWTDTCLTSSSEVMSRRRLNLDLLQHWGYGSPTGPDSNRMAAQDEQEGQDRAQEGQQKREGRRGRGGADDARSRLTLGGLLNFADGIRSSCGSERIFVFTTNHPERLDPALTRPGRMDLHIQLAYCSFNMFAALCKTYLGLTEHPLLGELAKVLRPESRLTPADVTAVLDAHRHDPDAALKEVLRRCSNKH